MENKRKTTGNRESRLPNRIYSKNFILAYGFNNEGFGVFFGLSAKSANNVKRNRIKRVFRSLVKERLMPHVDAGRVESLSVCLISKKGVKLGDNVLELREELESLVKNAADRIG